MKLYKNKVIKKAQGEVGYLEKETNAYLYSKKKNAGDKNFTKYGKWYNMNGVYWCCEFLSWLFAKSYGYENGLKLLCGGYSAACETIRQQFIKAGRYHSANGYTPKKGDVIFYWVKYSTRSDHIGIVERVSNGYVHTIEGNTSKANEVVDNGGAVARKAYAMSYIKILGYGNPNYDIKPTKLIAPKPTLKKGAKGASVKQLQKCLNATVHTGIIVDGDYGDKTSEALKTFKVSKKLESHNGDIYGKKAYTTMKKAIKNVD